MLIILDRDGVINEDSDAYIKSPEEWHAIPGSLQAIALLNQAGHTVVVASNQSGIGRGYFTEETLARIHDKMRAELAKMHGQIEQIFYCPHAPATQCQCRKPKPGLFWQIADAYHTDFKDALTIGDSLRDIQAAKAAGCKAVLVKTGKGERTIATLPAGHSIPVFASLLAVVECLLKEKNNFFDRWSGDGFLKRD